MLISSSFSKVIFIVQNKIQDIDEGIGESVLIVVK